MENDSLLAAFAVFVGIAFVLTWHYVSHPGLQVGGALYGIAGTDPITPFMAVLLVIWFILVAIVLFVNRARA